MMPFDKFKIYEVKIIEFKIYESYNSNISDFRLDPNPKILPLYGPFVTELKGLRRNINVACNN